MADPVVAVLQSAKAPDQDGSRSSATVALPSAPQSGNLLLGAVSWRALDSRTVNTPSGWSVVDAVGLNGSGAGIALFSKVATGSETSTTFTVSDANDYMSAQVIELSNAKDINAHALNANQTGTSNPITVSVTPATTNGLLLAFVTRDGGGTISSVNPGTVVQATSGSQGYHKMFSGQASAVTTSGTAQSVQFNFGDSSTPWSTIYAVVSVKVGAQVNLGGSGSLSTGTPAPRVAAAAALGGSASLSAVPPQQTVNYTASTAIISNPERGFFFYSESHYKSDNTGFNAMSQTDLTNARTGTSTFNGFTFPGISLAFRYYYIEKYQALDTIDSTYLQAVDADLAAVRAAGVKVVLRFAYTASDKNDATPARVVSHIKQLAPTLNKYADVIYALEAGFIGQYGEWYYTNNFGDQASVTAQNTTDRNTVISTLLGQLDSRIFVLLRYLGSRQTYLNTTSPNPGGDALRLGEHNDAFGSPYADYGTYTNFSSQTESQNRTYLDSISPPVPVGHESASKNSPTTDWANASSELAAHHFTFLNPQYHPDVISSWGQTNLDTASKNLGHRLRLVSATMPTSGSAGSTVNWSFTIANDGWAYPVVRRPIQVIADDGNGNVVTATATQDIRAFAPGASTTFSVSMTLPSAVTTYNSYLLLPDPSSAIASRPEYTIQLANTGNMWSSSTGRHNLGNTLVVRQTAFSGSAAISGTGTLAVGAAPAVVGPAALSGSGSLSTGAAAPAIAAAVAMSGSGALSTSRAPAIARTVALSGSGTMSTARTPAVSAAAPLAGAGTLSVATQVGGVGTAILGGSGTLAAQVSQQSSDTATLGGSGTLGTSGTPSTFGTATLSGSGTLSTAGAPAAATSVNLSGSGSLSSAQASSVAVQVAQTGSGSLSTAGVAAFTAAVQFGSEGTLGGSFGKSIAGSAATSTEGTLSTGAAPAPAVQIAVSGSGALSVAQVPKVAAVVPLGGSGALTAGAPAPSVAIMVAQAASGTLNGNGGTSSGGPVALAGTGTLSTPGAPQVSGTASITGSGSMSTGQTPNVAAAVSISGAGSLSSTGKPYTPVTVAIVGSGSLSTGAQVGPAVSTQVGGSGTLGTTGKPAYAVTVSQAAAGSLTTGAAPSLTSGPSLTGAGALSTSAGPAFAVLAALGGVGLVTTSAVSKSGIQVPLSGSGSLIAGGMPLLVTASQFGGAGSLTVAGRSAAIVLVALGAEASLSSSAIRTIALRVRPLGVRQYLSARLDNRSRR